MSTRFVMTPASFGVTSATASLRDIARRVALLHAVHVSRRELAEIELRLLEDVGISQRQAIDESQRALWDVKPTQPHRRDHGRGGAAKLAEFRAMFRAAMRRWRTRQRISQLDQHTLRDIGVTYAEAEREANKGFWQR